MFIIFNPSWVPMFSLVVNPALIKLDKDYRCIDMNTY